MKKLITTCAFLMLVSSIFAQTTFTDIDSGIKYIITSANTVEVTSKSPIYTGSIIIPSAVVNSGVTYNVTSIGYQAFLNCSGLTAVTIPSSVTSIGNQAFYNCSGLTAVTISNSVTSIGDNAFYNCSGLTSITIPSSVTSIGESVFYGCSLLTSITIPSSVTSIGQNAFDGTAWYTSHPDGVVYAGTVAYKYKGTMPPNTSITLNAGTTGIANSAFSNFTSLISITIPSSVTSIENSAFMNCSGLTSITIPSSVTSIENYAFYQCSALVSITIPSSVTSIGIQAFDATAWYTSQPDGLVYAGTVAYKYKGTMPTNTSITLNAGTTGIASSAFSYCSGLTSVSIPSSVTSIGVQAFFYCSGLTAVTIPSSVTSIGDQAFSMCEYLTTVTIPISSSITSIGVSAFDRCYRLTSISIPSLVTSIGNMAFMYCLALPSISIPSSVTSIGDQAFYGCSGLTSIDVAGDNVNYSSTDGVLFNKGKTTIVCYPGGGQAEYTIPSSVTSIGIWAFGRCTLLTSVTIPSSVTSIGNYAFYECSALASITIPSSVISIGQNAFEGTEWYTSQPDGVVYAGKIVYAYKGYMPANTSITLNAGTTAINSSAFSMLNGLTSITIPGSVTSIGDQAFRSSGLTSLTCLSSTPPTLGDGCFDMAPITNVYVPTDAAVTAYKANAAWSAAFPGTQIKKMPPITVGGIVYSITSDSSVEVTSKSPLYTSSITIPIAVIYSGVTYNVTSIGASAFSDCSGLTSITIPSSVTSIGTKAFYQCSFLTSFTIPDFVTSIGTQAFQGCSGLTSITVPSSVTSIGSFAFYDCSVLTSIDVDGDNANYSSTAGVLFNKDKTTIVCYPGGGQTVYTIPSSVTSIENYAFEGCIHLTSVTIPSSVTSIGSNAFTYCSDLASITIPSSVTSIGGGVFYGCSDLTSVDIQGSVISIGTQAFAYCSSLTAVTIPSSVTSIGVQAFLNCAGLTSATIPSSVTSIGSSAFEGCSGLTSVTIPSSVTSIGATAFKSCSGLTSLTCLSSTPPNLGFNCFLNVTAVTDVFVPTDAAVTAYKANTDWGAAFPDAIIKKMPPITVGDIVYSITSDSTVEVTSKSPLYEGIIEIPSTVDYLTETYNVTSIGDQAFDNCTSLTSIDIPNSVTSIGIQAFQYCSGLTSVTIPSSVISIGERAFDNCTSLTSITIPSSVTSIGNYAFYNCKSLTSVTIPNAVTSIGDYAFTFCTGLTSISIPSSISSIGFYAFYKCSGLTTITIPSSVTSIGEQAFFNCTGLTTLTCLSSTPPNLGSSCFSGVTNVTDVFVPTVDAVTAYRASSWFTPFQGTIIKQMPTSKSSGNWSASGTWTGGVVPTAGQPVVIAHTISLDVNASVSDLTINNGSALNVNAGIQLTVSTTLTNNGALNLLSDADNGTATILTPATLSGAGTYSVQQYLTSGRNWYVSSPVASAQKNVFNATIASNVYSFNEATGAWLDLTDPVTALSPLIGYVAAVTSDGTVTFTGGKLNTGAISDATLTATAGTYRGFHLVGNPYPSYTNWVMATKTNLEPSIWYRTKNVSGSAVFDTFGATSHLGTHNNNNDLIDVTEFIAPMQAVWVRVNTGTTGTVGFDNSMRSHNDQTVPTNRLKSIALTTQQVLRLQVSNGINSDEAIILFNTNAADGYDEYDSPKMSNNIVTIPEIYTLAGSEQVVINGLNSVSANPALTLGFTTGAASTFTIKATEISNFEEGTVIILKDNLLNTEKELTIGTDYSFSSPVTTTATRFTVLFKSPAITTAVDNDITETLAVFQQNGHITINRNNALPGTVTVYNAMGKKLTGVSTTGTNTVLNMNFVPGVYLVTVTVGGNNATKKILIK